MTAMSEDNGTTGEDSATDGTTASGDAGPESSEDAQKRKFKEALDRKAGGKGGGGDAHSGSKIHSAQGPAKAQRSFRRKSGG